MKIKKIAWQQTIPLRHGVLWPNKPPEFCHVDGDAAGLDFGAFIDQELVCVASVYLQNNKAQLRKFATDERYQHQGIRSKMLKHIIEWLQNTQVESFWCDARETALGFYQRFDMDTCSERFCKAGVYYYKMEVFLR